jgi:hypothetical protein
MKNVFLWCKLNEYKHTLFSRFQHVIIKLRFFYRSEFNRSIHLWQGSSQQELWLPIKHLISQFQSTFNHFKSGIPINYPVLFKTPKCWVTTIQVAILIHLSIVSFNTTDHWPCELVSRWFLPSLPLALSASVIRDWFNCLFPKDKFWLLSVYLWLFCSRLCSWLQNSG